MKISKSSKVCLSCSDKCCSQPYVNIPLSSREAGIAKALGYTPKEKRGLALMPSGFFGCEAYATPLGRCGIYKQKPAFCSLYPIEVIAAEEPLGIYDSVRTEFALLLVNCDLGKRIQPSPASLLKELQKDNLLETLKNNAMQFNRVKKADLEERVRDGTAEVFYFGEIS